MDERRRLVALAILVLVPQIALTLWLLSVRLAAFGEAIPVSDFASFYTGGIMANEGRLVAAYDPEIYQATMRAVAADLGPVFWLYPPTMVPFVQAFSQGTYWWGCVLWLAFGSAAWGLAAYRLDGWRGVLWMVGFPPTVIALVYAQASLWLALFLAEGLRLLEERPVVAGALFGVLSVKPHWLMVVVVALLAGRHVRALVSAGLVSLAMAAASVVAFGIEPWQAWLGCLGTAIAWVPLMGAFDVVSPYSAVPLAAASTVQAVATAVGLGATVWVFATRHPHDLRMSIVPIATSLTSPYMHFYDLVALGIPALMIGRRLHAAGHSLLPFASLVGITLWGCRVVGAMLEVQPYPLVAGIALVAVLRIGRQPPRPAIASRTIGEDVPTQVTQS